jgi:hypothetical protein
MDIHSQIMGVIKTTIQEFKVEMQHIQVKRLQELKVEMKCILLSTFLVIKMIL